ncbi:MAG: T9SS type A sorting domain-containing protein, partial [Bacteroidota bacterium]
SVQDPAPTQLVVYDLLGREVARLVDQTLTPGTYEVAFDRSALASGVYVYRLVSGATSAHRTMTLVD